MPAAVGFINNGPFSGCQALYLNPDYNGKPGVQRGLVMESGIEMVKGAEPYISWCLSATSIFKNENTVFQVIAELFKELCFTQVSSVNFQLRYFEIFSTLMQRFKIPDVL